MILLILQMVIFILDFIEQIKDGTIENGLLEPILYIL